MSYRNYIKTFIIFLATFLILSYLTFPENIINISITGIISGIGLLILIKLTNFR